MGRLERIVGVAASGAAAVGATVANPPALLTRLGVEALRLNSMLHPDARFVIPVVLNLLALPPVRAVVAAKGCQVLVRLLGRSVQTARNSLSRKRRREEEPGEEPVAEPGGDDSSPDLLVAPSAEEACASSSSEQASPPMSGAPRVAVLAVDAEDEDDARPAQATEICPPPRKRAKILNDTDTVADDQPQSCPGSPCSGQLTEEASGEAEDVDMVLETVVEASTCSDMPCSDADAKSSASLPADGQSGPASPGCDLADQLGKSNSCPASPASTVGDAGDHDMDRVHGEELDCPADRLSDGVARRTPCRSTASRSSGEGTLEHFRAVSRPGYPAVSSPSLIPADARENCGHSRPPGTRSNARTGVSAAESTPSPVFGNAGSGANETLMRSAGVPCLVARLVTANTTAERAAPSEDACLSDVRDRTNLGQRVVVDSTKESTSATGGQATQTSSRGASGLENRCGSGSVSSALNDEGKRQSDHARESDLFIAGDPDTGDFRSDYGANDAQEDDDDSFAGALNDDDDHEEEEEKEEEEEGDDEDEDEDDEDEDEDEDEDDEDGSYFSEFSCNNDDEDDSSDGRDSICSSRNLRLAKITAKVLISGAPSEARRTRSAGAKSSSTSAPRVRRAAAAPARRRSSSSSSSSSSNSSISRRRRSSSSGDNGDAVAAAGAAARWTRARR